MNKVQQEDSSQMGILCVCNVCLEKNQNAPRPSEHPPVKGEKMSKRLGWIKGCKYKTSSWHIPFIMDVRLVDIHTTCIHAMLVQPGSQDRRKVTRDFSPFLLRCLFCHNFSRQKDSAVPFPHRP